MAAGNIAKALRANNYLAPVADVVKNYYAKQAEQQRKKQLLDLQTNVINNLNAAMQPKQVTEQVDLSPYKNLSPTGNLPAATEEAKPDPVYGLLKGLMPNTMVPPSPQVSEPQQAVPAPTEQMYGKVDLAKTILPTPQQKQDAINSAQMEYLQGLQGMTDDPQAQQALSSQIIAATIAKLKPQTPQTVKLGGNEAIYELNPATNKYEMKVDNRIEKQEDVKTDSVIRNEGRKKIQDIYQIDKNGKRTLIQSLPAGEKEVSVGESLAQVERENKRRDKLGKLSAKVIEGINKIDGFWQSEQVGGRYKVGDRTYTKQQMIAEKESKIKPEYVAAADELLTALNLKSNDKDAISYLDAVRQLVDKGLSVNDASDKLGLDSDEKNAMNLYFTISRK